jgi:hypothetical protein
MITHKMFQTAQVMMDWANRGIFHGLAEEVGQLYFKRASRLFAEEGQPLITSLLCTRDEGYHSSGWFKNPDYERCYSLSLGFYDKETGKPAPFDASLAEAWVRAFFGEAACLVWHEGPKYKFSEDTCEVHFFRLFCDPAWQALKPRGEVYTRDFIQAGWQSFSEIQGKKKENES